MTSKEIRQKFLTFFEEKGHDIVPSAPMVLKNDPSLMFTNAGMNQFKDYFLGNKTAANPRVADTQKCLRVSGKHNDLEEVGIDTYHHTMFEMLGNWSFGDYFKQEAIAWAWELLSKVYGLPEDCMYVTVFGGDKQDNLPADEEAADFWKEHVSAERILYAGKKDNFWEMGDTGPCGPCSEIHIDLRPESERQKVAGKTLVNSDHPQVVEIWNLVFMQFNRLASGELQPLPAQHVDTGMGFERLCMAIQGKQSNYDTDVFSPLIRTMEKLSAKQYGSNEQTDIAFRVIVDHIRAIALAIADGQLPSNNGAGYVIRRILRRAVRYGYTFLDFRQAFMYQLVAVLAEQYDGVFPELIAQQDLVTNVIREEEQSFLRTLENGLKRLEQIKNNTKGKIISGEQAFELYDTYGFPFDLTSLIARESDLSVDENGFQKEMQVQKNRSKDASKTETGDWIVVNEGQEVSFIGYDVAENETRILRYREVKGKKGNQIQLVLEQTPFYAESGGQVGDVGTLHIEGELVKVLDTKKENDLIVHFIDQLPENIYAKVSCKVDVARRRRIVSNHSATHLMHAALRNVLGEHVQQKGSLVNEHLLRFDFSHFAKMTSGEIKEVERIVNEKIRANIPRGEQRSVPLEEAKAMGAMALFGEKYGDSVRVITFDPEYSIELCGGIHVEATGNIGLFKIISEGSVAAGVRRIEAVTGESAYNFVEEQLGLIEELNELLKNPNNLPKAVQALLEDRQRMGKELESLQLKQTADIKGDLIDTAQQRGEVKVIVSELSLPSADALKKLSFELKNEISTLFAVLAANIDGKPQIAVVLSDDLVADGLNASQIVRELATHIKGGGGGQPFFATAGGKELKGLTQVVIQAKARAEEMLG